MQHDVCAVSQCHEHKKKQSNLGVVAAEKNLVYSVFANLQFMTSNLNLLIGDGVHQKNLVWRNGHGKRKDETALELLQILSPFVAAAMYRKGTPIPSRRI